MNNLLKSYFDKQKEIEILHNQLNKLVKEIEIDYGLIINGCIYDYTNIKWRQCINKYGNLKIINLDHIKQEDKDYTQNHFDSIIFERDKKLVQIIEDIDIVIFNFEGDFSSEDMDFSTESICVILLKNNEVKD